MIHATVGPQQQPQQQGGQTSTATSTPAADPRSARVMAALASIPANWRTLLGSLLQDVDPPQTPYPEITDDFRRRCYEIMAKRDGSGRVGVVQIGTILQLYPSRRNWAAMLEELEAAAREDTSRRTLIHDCITDLRGGGEVRYNSDRILAHWAMTSKWGRDWWQSEDARPWITEFETYFGDDEALEDHAGYGTPVFFVSQRREKRDQRKRAIQPLLWLLRSGSLTGVKPAASAAAAGPQVAPPTEEERTAATALKSEIEPYLPPDGAVGDDAKPERRLDHRKRQQLITKIQQAPERVRDLVFGDAVFMRRVAMLGDNTAGGGTAAGSSSLLDALDPIENLHQKCQGWTTDAEGRRTSAMVNQQQRYDYISGFMTGHPGDGNRELRMRVMTHTGLRQLMIFTDAQKRDLWRLAARGTLEPTAEDRLYEAVKGDNAEAAARALLGMTADDRTRMRALQDDLMFRTAISSEAMRSLVNVDGVQVKPYDLCLLMWGMRPGAVRDPGQNGPVEDNLTGDDKPLNVDERRTLDRELYDPTISRLQDELSASESWFFGGARTDDDDVVSALRSFRQKAADEKYKKLVQRAGVPPGQELATRYNARTGKSIRYQIDSGCGTTARREADLALQITVDSASVGTVAGQIGLATDRPQGAAATLDQLLGETKVDDGRTVSQVVQDQAKRLKSELHSGGITDWDGADVSDCKKIWDDLKRIAEPKLPEIRRVTQRNVHLIELLQNAYQAIDGPLVEAMKSGLGLGELVKVLPYYGLDQGSIDQRAAQSTQGQQNQLDTGRQQAEQVFGDKGKELFAAFAGLDTLSRDPQFAAVKDKMAAYLALRPAAPVAASVPARGSGEIPPDLLPGTGQTAAATPEDYYGQQFGLTPLNHAVQVARAFRTPPTGYAYDSPEHSAGEGNTPQSVAGKLGIPANLVEGPVQAPPDDQVPVIDDRNRTLVRPGFTVETANSNAAEMWRILQGRGEVHLIQTRLYGVYNDEEQRLIRLAFRRLSGGIDWQFYIQQARYMADHNQTGLPPDQAGDDRRGMMVGAEGTAAGQAISNTGMVSVMADRTELDTALAVATQGSLDIRTELRSAIGHSNYNEIFRIVDRADDAQARTILADQDLMRRMHSLLDSYGWDRVHRVLTRQDDLSVRLLQRAQGDQNSFWERNFGGTHEEGMKEDIREYIRRLRIRFEDDVRREARTQPLAPDPAMVSAEVNRRVREACRQLMANPDVVAILEDEMKGYDLSSTRGVLMGGGTESNVAAVAGGSHDADEILAEIRRMPVAERQRKLRDPEYMRRLTDQLAHRPADMQQAVDLLSSGAPQEQEGGVTSGGGNLAELARLTSVRGNRDYDNTLKLLVGLSPDEHQRLINDPRLVAQVMETMRSAGSAKLQVAQRVLGYRPDNALNTLGQGVVFPDAQGPTCEGRTFSQEEQQRLAYLQANACMRVRQGATRGWDQMLYQVIEIYKMDLKPREIVGQAPGAADQQPAPAPSPNTPRRDPNADLAKQIEDKIRAKILEESQSTINGYTREEYKRRVMAEAILKQHDPSAERIRDQWGTLDDNEEGVEDTLRNVSDQLLVDKWTSVAMNKPNGTGSMKAAYEKYREARDAAEAARVTDPNVAQLKLDFMNYVIDVSGWFESDLLPNAGNSVWGDDQNLTPDGAPDSRVRTRDNKQYNDWRKIIRDRIPKLPKPLIAEKIGAGDRNDDIALIDNPNRQALTQEQYMGDEYLRRFAVNAGGARVADEERAVVNDTMTRYGREVGEAQTNQEGGYGTITTAEGVKIERTREQVERALQEFVAARAKIAGWAALVVSLVVGAIVTIATAGAGSGLAFMLVAGAISGAAGAAGGVLAQEAIQGQDYDAAKDGAREIATGAITGMITAGTTKISNNIMNRLAGQATLRGQAGAAGAAMAQKTPVWQQLLAAAGRQAGEEAIEETLSGLIEAGLVPLDPAVWVNGWDEGVIRARQGIRQKLTEIPDRALTAAITSALTVGLHGGKNALFKGKNPPPLTPDNRQQIRGRFERYMATRGLAAQPYLDVGDVFIEALATYVVDRGGDLLAGREIKWDEIGSDLLRGFLEEWKEAGSEAVTGVSDHHEKRRDARHQQLRENGTKFTSEAERQHYIALNPDMGFGDIITVDEFLLAREGMFQGRMAAWETELANRTPPRSLTPGEVAAFQRWCRKARDSAEYQRRLETDPTTVEEVTKAGFTTTDQNAGGTDTIDLNVQPSTTTTTPTTPTTPTTTPTTPTTTTPVTTTPQPTVDQMMQVTGEAEAVPDSGFTGQARRDAEPAKVRAAITQAVNHMVGHFPEGTIQVLGPNTLRVKTAGGATFTVIINTMVAEGEAVARYRFTGTDTGSIEISDRARDKHVERAIAHEIAEMMARREAMAEGKSLPTEDALKQGATTSELSAHDLGRIAELKVLLRQLAEAKNPVDGGKPNPVAIDQLNKDIDTLLAHLGLTGEAGTKRLHELVDPRLSTQEKNALLIRSDDDRRKQVHDNLPAHSGVEVHNHFLGIVDPKTFADRAAAAEAKRQGKSVADLGKSGWEVMLDQIAAMEGIAHKKADGTVAERGEKFSQRGTSGDAVAMARLTRGVIGGQVGTVDAKIAPSWLVKGARDMQALRVALEAAQNEGRTDDVDRINKQIAELKAQLAEQACRLALTATDDTDFNSAYEVRDELIKKNFGNDKMSNYEDFARETVRGLILDGLLYNEQSNSLKKLNEKFTKPMMDKVIWDVTAELLAAKQITEKQAMQLRQLTMVLTGFFGQEETRAGEETEEDKRKRAERFNDENWEKAKKGLKEQLEGRSDVAGVDIAGPETARFDPKGQIRFQELYLLLKEAAEKRGRPMVLRPHVGEGFVDAKEGEAYSGTGGKKSESGEGTHYERARANLDALLDAVEAMGGQLDPSKVVIRFGHSTHATADQAKRMAKLGIIAEVNLHSNVDTQVLDQVDPKTGQKSKSERFQDHSLLSLIYYSLMFGKGGVILSTDAHSVMHTTMSEEYERAYRIIEEFLAGRQVLRLTPEEAKGRGTEKTVVVGRKPDGSPETETMRELARGDLNAEELQHFMKAYESLHLWAKSYQDQVAKGDKTDKLMWRDLFALLGDAETTKAQSGKWLQLRNLVRRLAMNGDSVDEVALEFARTLEGGVYAGRLDQLRHAIRNILAEPEGNKAVERWQTHGIEDTPAVKDWLKDEEFRKWYEIWIRQPDRVYQDTQGVWRPKFPPGMPDTHQDRITKITAGGNVSLMHQATDTAAQIAELFPQLESMDPETPEYQAVRAQLVELLSKPGPDGKAQDGLARVVKFEQTIKGKRGDKERAALDARVTTVLDDSALAEIKRKFPGCEVLLTGSLTQASKDVTAIADIDIIVVAPADMTYEQRVQLEQNAKGLKVRTTQQFQELNGGKKAELEVDAKVMTPREAFGMVTAPAGVKEDKKTGAVTPRTEMNYLRIADGVTRDPTKDADGDGVQDAARVGVPGNSVPDLIPRLDNLNPEERKAEKRFADAYEQDPDKLAKEYLDLVMSGQTDKEKKNFATDDAKLLSPDYNPEDGTDAEKLAARGLMNVAVHQTANAVAKRAFIMRLEQIAKEGKEPKKILVTAGGVGAGKSFAIKNNPKALAMKQESSIVWDSAGEQNSTELAWVIAEAKKLGFEVAIVYVHRRPDQSWENMDFGVIPRAGKEGRMVDARLHADSYAEGARNFDAVQQKFAADSTVKFVVIDATDKPTEIPRLPSEALDLDADQVHARNVAFLRSKTGLSDHVVKGGADVGERVWGKAEKPMPRTADEARALRAMGVTWSGQEIYDHFEAMWAAIDKIPPDQNLSTDDQKRQLDDRREAAYQTALAMLPDQDAAAATAAKP